MQITTSNYAAVLWSMFSSIVDPTRVGEFTRLPQPRSMLTITQPLPIILTLLTFPCPIFEIYISAACAFIPRQVAYVTGRVTNVLSLIDKQIHVLVMHIFCPPIAVFAPCPEHLIPLSALPLFHPNRTE